MYAPYGQASEGYVSNPSRRPTLLTAVIAVVIAWSSISASAGPAHLVVILTSDPHSSPGNEIFEKAVRASVAKTAVKDVEYEVEHLDLVYTDSPSIRENFKAMFLAKYKDREPDVVITVGATVLKFALQERAIFGNAAIVFCHVQQSDVAGLDSQKGVAGFVSPWFWPEQLDEALRLLPTTRRAVVILGNGPFERAYEPQLRAELARFAKKLDIEWWVGVPMHNLEDRISNLPPHTVALYIGIYRDSEGETFMPTLALASLARRANVPIFGSLNHWVGEGVIGDGRSSSEEIGDEVGTAVARIFTGARPESLGIVKARGVAPTFDARQLAHFNIPRNRLPADAVVLFEEPGLWDTHRGTVIAGLTIMLLQALLIAAFLQQRLARRRAESSERDSLSLYSFVADSIIERLATLAPDGTIISVNRAWSEFAKTHERYLEPGENYVQIVKAAIERGQRDAARTLEAVEAVLSGRDNSRRLEYFSPGDGDRWRYEMHIVSLQKPDGGAVITVQDITDRWRSEERVRVAIESIPFATLLLDVAGRIELANAEVQRLFGYRQEELLGHSLTHIIPTFSSEAHPAPEMNIDLITGGHVKEDVKGVRRDGSEIQLQVNLRTISLTARTIVLVSVLDVSERRRLDAEVQRLREETAHFGRVATAGEMSAAIAHELNQPLTGIMMNCQAAQRLLERGAFSTEDIVEMFSDIVADTRRAGEVIQRLRLMLRKQPAEIRALDLNDSVKQVVRLVHHDLAIKGAALDLELSEDLPPVTGDRVHLQQVIVNLVLNAADAMIGVPAEQRRMVLRTGPGFNRTVELEVRDAGPGISPEAMRHIFEPFFTTKPNGMGMGLSIVRSIVESHSGRITCANAASGGAVFRVTLPAAERMVAA
jgi:two-component system, LuxR family, sensor kinase FixL